MRLQTKITIKLKFSIGSAIDVAFRKNLKSVVSGSITLPDLVNESSNLGDNVWVQARK